MSPSEGSRRLHVARDLVLDMPNTHRLLATGEISGWTARLVTGELSHLDPPTRQGVDTELGQAHLEQKSPKAAARQPSASPMPPTRTVPPTEAGRRGKTGGSRCGRRRTR